MSHVKNVAIVGATGSVGKFIVDALLKEGKHTVTAITRANSDTAIPEGLQVAKVSYDDHSSLVEALKGQEVLIITMSVGAPPDTQAKLINAAADAGVPFVIPNNWGIDPDNEKLCDDIYLGESNRAVRKQFQDLGGKVSRITFVSGFWYEFSLGGSPDRFGFDFKNRSVIFFDDGKQQMNTTTWPQTGLAVARLLALPVDGEGETLSSFKNRNVYISSFRVSQQDMFESVLRVTGTKPEDWKISYENSKERYEGAVELLKKGNNVGFVRLMYTRVFYPDGSGVYENMGLQNELLGLPQEDFDEATKIGIEREGFLY